MKKDLIIVGASDTADRIISFVKRYDLFNIKGLSVNKGFIPDNQSSILIGGGKYPLFSLEDIDNYRNENTLFFVAILWNRLNADRRDMFNTVKSMGLPMTNIISPLSSIRGEIIGTNCLISDFAVSQERSVIYDNVWIMDHTAVGHRSSVQAHSFCGIRSTIGGSSNIGNQSFLGLGSTIFDEVNIGEKCLIGASIYVKRNLPPYSVVKTANDSTIIKQYPADVIESKWLAHHNRR